VVFSTRKIPAKESRKQKQKKNDAAIICSLSEKAHATFAAVCLAWRKMGGETGGKKGR
jgi:hypothetical protein